MCSSCMHILSLCFFLRCFVFLLFCLASAERQRIAKEVASVLKLSVEIDTSLSERLVQFSRDIFAQKIKKGFHGHRFSFYF